MGAADRGGDEGRGKGGGQPQFKSCATCRFTQGEEKPSALIDISLKQKGKRKR